MPESSVARDPGDGAMLGANLSEAALRDCVLAGIAAPSIHNTQPWRFRIGGGGIDVYADWTRRLDVIDPFGRELLISVGAAVFNVRLAMRVHGRAPTLLVSPDPAQPDLAARVVPGRFATAGSTFTALANAIPRRHTNRRPFARKVVPASVIEELAAAADIEGATLRVADAVGRGAILGLVRTAEQRLRADGVYRAELSTWTLPEHGRNDGLPPRAFGPWDAMEALPLRDFGITLPQLHRVAERFEPFPTIVVLCTAGDTPEHWLVAGQALQRVLLLATVHGLAATPMSQPLEIPALRELVTGSGTDRWAQLILRLGYAQPTQPTPRRPLSDVLLP
jgi:nitroreductase